MAGNPICHIPYAIFCRLNFLMCASIKWVPSKLDSRCYITRRFFRIQVFSQLLSYLQTSADIVRGFLLTLVPFITAFIPTESSGKRKQDRGRFTRWALPARIHKKKTRHGETTIIRHRTPRGTSAEDICALFRLPGFPGSSN